MTAAPEIELHGAQVFVVGANLAQVDPQIGGTRTGHSGVKALEGLCDPSPEQLGVSARFGEIARVGGLPCAQRASEIFETRGEIGLGIRRGGFVHLWRNLPER